MFAFILYCNGPDYESLLDPFVFGKFLLPNRTSVSLHVLFHVFFAVVFVDGARKREEYLLHPPFPNVARPTLPRLDSGSHC